MVAVGFRKPNSLTVALPVTTQLTGEPWNNWLTELAIALGPEMATAPSSSTMVIALASMPTLGKSNEPITCPSELSVALNTSSDAEKGPAFPISMVAFKRKESEVPLKIDASANRRVAPAT